MDDRETDRTDKLRQTATDRPALPVDVAAFINGSMEGLRLQTAAHSAGWRLGKEKNWLVDQEAGTIEFQFADGIVASAPVQIIGTFDPADSTFLWGWGHPSVQPPLRRHAELVRDYGRQYQLARLTTRQLVSTEEEAWEFTALAVRLAEANGAYRGNAGGPWVYVTFGEIGLQKRG